MNKNCFRVIFNKVRGMLMVVADITVSGRVASSSCTDVGPTPCSRLFVYPTLHFALLLSLGCVTLSAQAGVVADARAPGNQQATIINAANGTPQVNIQTPSRGGVSRNVYSQFDVDQKGVVLNNARANTQSQLVGMIAGNPNLARGEAKVILNEVNAANASQLNGFVEVAGQRAQVVIANPSGITCNGCGFINANRATLTTGQVQMNNGQIAGYDVNTGEIVVQGAGMESSQQDSTDLIARAVSVNAGIWARELKVTTGRNTVNADHNEVTAKAPDGSTSPRVAVDVSALGGMYANKIRLLGTEKGVGVHNAGHIGASAGNVVVNADGSITNSGSLMASAHLQLTSQGSIGNSGKAYAAGNTDIHSRGALNNSGIIAAGRDTTLNAAAINSNAASTLGAGIDVNGTKGGAGNLTLSSQADLTVNGKAIATGQLVAEGAAVNVSASQMQGRDISLRADSGDISTSNAVVEATNGFTASAKGKLTNRSGSISAGTLTLTGAALNNQQGVLQQLEQRDLSLSFVNGIDNAGGTLAANAKNFTINAPIFNNQRGSLLHLGEGDLTLFSAETDGSQGAMLSKGSLNLNSGKLVLDNATTEASRLSLTATSFSHRQGEMRQISSGAMSVAVDGTLDNQRGSIATNGDLNLRAADLNNQAGKLLTGQQGGMQIETQNRLNNEQGMVAAAGALSLLGNGLNNQAGLLQSGAAMTIDLHNGDLDNRNSGSNGGIVSYSTLSLSAGNIDNAVGFIAAGDDAAITGRRISNQQGVMASDAGLNLTSSVIDNQGGRVQAGNALIATAGAGIDNTAGLFRSGNSLLLTTDKLINSETQGENSGIAGASVTLNSTVVDNTIGSVRASDLLEINTATLLDNSGGILSSGSVLAVNGGNTLTFTNGAGTLIAGSALNLNANALSGDGRVLSQNAMTLVMQQAFFNQGEVIASGDMTFNLGGSGLVNQSLIQAGGSLTLGAGSLDNQQSAEISATENHLLISGNLINRGLLDGGFTHIVSALLTNIGSGRLYGDRIALQTSTLNNLAENGQAATIAARERLDIGTQTLNNRDHALIYSGGDVVIGGLLDGNQKATGKGSVLNNHSAILGSAGNMTLDIAEINNINDHLVTETVVVEQSFHHEAVLKDSTNRFDWADIDTSGKNKYGVHEAIMPDGTRGRTFYEYEYQRTITETQVKESDPGQLIAGGNLTINSNRVNNHDSRIVAGGLLGGAIGALNNIATVGQRIITDVGTQVRWYAKKTSSSTGPTKTSQGKDRSGYQPATIMQTIDLQTMAWQGNTSANSNGVTIGNRETTVKVIDPDAADIGQTAISLPPGQIVEIVQPKDSSDSMVIRAIAPDTTLPDNSLFTLHPNSDVPYLIETDPRFTHQNKWLGSDYMQNQFTQDANNVLRRLGDGYYEQQLIRQQVLAVTGNRYLAGYHSDEAQYQALMDAGVTFAKAHGLKPGVALSAQQMALLTSDMVWLVEQTVTLPDGRPEKVLVPQLYARVKPGDLDGSGALLTGNGVALAVSHDLTNSGHINGRSVMQLTADNLNNSGFIGGDSVDLRARADINNIGGTLQGGSSLIAIAGRDLNSISTTGGSGGNITFDRPAGIYVQADNGTLGLQAMHDINLTATQISNAGTESRTQIVAGHDLNLNTLTVTKSERGDWGGGNNRSLTQSTDVGSQINGGGEVSLSAGHDLNARAAAVTAEGNLSAAAGNDIALTSGNASYHLVDNSHQRSGGMLSHKSVTMHDEVQSQTAVGSSFSGDRIIMQAGRDLTMSGSSVVATQDVALSAVRNITLTTADETRQENHWRKEKKSGLSGTGGIGVTAGSSTLKITDVAATHSSAGSIVGSTGGSVNLSAGSALTVKGSDVLAAKDLHLTGKEVNILAAENGSTQTHTVEQKQSGLTLALSGTVGSAINTAVSGASDASTESSGRLAALLGMKSALSGVQAAQGISLAEAGGSEGSVIGVNLSYGSQSSKSEQTLTQNQSQGSRLTAGNNLNLHATGTDINVQGSQLQAGKDVGLSAARDVNLSSGLNSQTLDGKNESHGASVGVGINFGQGANGLSLNASVNKGKGSETGNGTRHVETTVNAGKNLTISSGRDTTLTGAQVSGEKVMLDVGRNLTLTSEQDTDNYDSKQQNASAGGSVSMGGGSGSVNLSRDKMHSTYESVQEQTGIFAGKGGFDITVGEHTELTGAVIGSTATADKNRLETGTLGFSDIRNSAEYEVEHQSAGVSSGGNTGGQFAGNMANSLLVGVNGSGSDSSTTKSAVSDGIIIIRDSDNQKQDVGELSRDVEHANQTLSPIFDKEKEQNRLKEAQLIGEIGSQAADIARTQGDLEGLKAKKDPAALQAAREQLAGQGNLNPTAEQIAQQAYNTAMAPYGTGSALQQGIQAATAAIQGLAGGDLAKALAGGSAPYIAGVIGSSGLDDTGKVLAHAAVNAALAAAQGNNALVGAAGAATAEMVGMIALNAYGKPVSELSESEKQTVSALATLAAGLAGGLAGNGTADVVAAAQAGQTTVTNNLLGATSSDKLDKVVEKIKQGDRSLAAANELIQLENADKRSDALVSKFTSNPSQMNSSEQAELAAYLRVYASEMEQAYGTAVAQELVKGLLSGQDYIKRNPDSEAMSQAQTIMNTWGYHKSNASIGDAPLIFGSSVLGSTIKEGMALNAAIGVGVNTGVQLSGNDPFSYVDAIMAGVTSAATTGKGLIPSAGINMGGAAIGSGIKGEDPTNSVAGAGAGTVAGGIGGAIIKGVTSKVAEEAVSDLTGAIGGSYISEETGNFVKGHLDEKGKNENEK
ncbi:hemagglutinin repeat-containing protein [Erwinia oleae]|uniref:hemagglutinin repeat-containing protein n=1 Tax=Erwinia oleae TaxID=796334 RepID=UPI00068AA97C|nr:hemagglutinin repeat-containing protein [Erwinia oleae]